ncbi:DASH family cryptochrome [Endozoicomonas montiporae]|uniref:Cryptochrome DASH n=1 Tax=Endozoicomonas montiporae CL-33 TaxID=570277 RepID=A0A142BE93_9GAMM|nr:DASH family cryptochrome [Endozoicomonas montiporae]AMO57069.1 deoxyribodipyrimidine photolyase [Endozoicomonas montiporae CL-33]
MQGIALFLFTNDLRLSDNPAYLAAATGSRHLLCCYCVDPAWFRPGRYMTRRMGEQRWRFLRESLKCLESSLAERRQKLLVRYQSPSASIQQLIQAHGIEKVYRSRQSGYEEVSSWLELKQRFPSVLFSEIATSTLFEIDQLPFELHDLPGTYSQFRRKVEKLAITEPVCAPDLTPSPVVGFNYLKDQLPSVNSHLHSTFKGGEKSGLRHLSEYFSTPSPSVYKQTRNALMGWDASTKLSPWLAHGCISPRQVMSALKCYETDIVANESTYWILFELLWREYFFWYALKHGVLLFSLKGISARHKLSSFYGERFQKWCAGNTPWPLVNACMKELKETGYLSNRGRQIVASCFIHELGMDWRYGAAWFEEQLIDYDVGSNWGNWQYLAGVGADPRGIRHFDLDKQTSQYDPDGAYIRRWGGESTCLLDSVDAADWPILK